MKFIRDEGAGSSEPVKDTPVHRGSNAVAAVFHIVAAVAFGLGLIAAVVVGTQAHRHMGDSTGRSIAYTLAVALGGIFLASVLAFFGHVLNLLAEIADNTRVQQPAKAAFAAASSSAHRAAN